MPLLTDAQAGVPPGAGAVPAALGPAPEVEELPNVSPEEQAEYERVTGALYTMLYKNDKPALAIAKGIQPDQKVGSVAQVSMITIKQLDEQLDIDDVVIAQLTVATVGAIIEIAEAADIKFSEVEQDQALATAWEGVMIMFGGDGSIQEDYDALTGNMSPEQIQEAHSMAQTLLEDGGAGFDTGGQGAPAPAAAPAPPGGQPPVPGVGQVNG